MFAAGRSENIIALLRSRRAHTQTAVILRATCKTIRRLNKDTTTHLNFKSHFRTEQEKRSNLFVMRLIFATPLLTEGNFQVQFSLGKVERPKTLPRLFKFFTSKVYTVAWQQEITHKTRIIIALRIVPKDEKREKSKN
jgi:hypothetical protein